MPPDPPLHLLRIARHAARRPCSQSVGRAASHVARQSFITSTSPALMPTGIGALRSKPLASSLSSFSHYLLQQYWVEIHSDLPVTQKVWQPCPRSRIPMFFWTYRSTDKAPSGSHSSSLLM
ncbi:uncharacterized protein LOC133909865 [Phragmites australis]|uniref:uncharacterized protein LOC133909865 n=1 Tax=Phragmites australis TaxID=29695 RepID=UPI002D79EE6B|nr:uncharacterized protein LOC133909865 [Phragmites australis]